MRFADATVSVSVGGDGLVTSSTAPDPRPSLPSPGELPFTGTAVELLTLIALFCIVAGLVLIVLSHRREPNNA